MKIVVAFSGGKDSQASLIWACNHFNKENIKAVFCDTGWEHPLTYQHVRDVCKTLGIELIILKSKKYDGMLDLAIKRKRFPSTKARFCTTELKSIPMIDWILEQRENLLIIQGIRKDESLSRSKMQENCRMFRYYFESYKIDKKGKPLYHTYRKKKVREWCENFDDSILRPVFDWSGQQVIDYIIKNGHKPNPLYYKGANRVGCFPCIMTSKKELRAMIEPNYPNNDIREYWENKGGYFLLKNIENNEYIHLHDLDYLEYRYKVYPITKENLGFIISEYRRFKKFYNQLVKHFISINQL